MAKEIKKEINIPVIFVGRVNNPEDIKKLKKDYSARDGCETAKAL